MPQSYPNYVTGTPDGSATALASLGGDGARKLGGTISTFNSSGANRNVLDDGAGNMTIAGVITSQVSSPSGLTLPAPTSGAPVIQNPGPGARDFYQRISANASGSYIVTLGATSGGTVSLGTYSVTAGSDEMVTVHVPAGWWVGVNVTTVNYGVTHWF